ncbi:MAG: hypothetical protein VX502_04175 [Candidatus Thermoplasmatota archaeon]|nr:hypothetical protein [Candidatus Thermoplasmatota archaeon]
MVGAATFHAMFVEIVIGSLTLSTICAICCIQRAFPSPITNFRLSEAVLSAMDKAAFAGAILGVTVMPMAILSGTLAAPGDGAGSGLLYNKLVYSGLSLGFWGAFLTGRIRLGPGIWEDKRLNLLQAGTAAIAFLMTTTAASIGGKLVRDESVFDILPLWLPTDTATVLHPVISGLLLLVGIASIAVAFRFAPKVRRLD